MHCDVSVGFFACLVLMCAPRCRCHVKFICHSCRSGCAQQSTFSSIFGLCFASMLSSLIEGVSMNYPFCLFFVLIHDGCVCMSQPASNVSESGLGRQRTTSLTLRPSPCTSVCHSTAVAISFLSFVFPLFFGAKQRFRGHSAGTCLLNCGKGVCERLLYQREWCVCLMS